MEREGKGGWEAAGYGGFLHKKWRSRGKETENEGKGRQGTGKEGVGKEGLWIREVSLGFKRGEGGRGKGLNGLFI